MNNFFPLGKIRLAKLETNTFFSSVVAEHGIHEERNEKIQILFKKSISLSQSASIFLSLDNRT
jgi:hypothetical protein